MSDDVIYVIYTVNTVESDGTVDVTIIISGMQRSVCAILLWSTSDGAAVV